MDLLSGISSSIEEVITYQIFQVPLETFELIVLELSKD